MRTVFVEPPPAELRAWLDRRRRDGLDRFDEVWDGEYHVAPAPHGRHAAVDHQLARVLGPLADAAGLLGAGPLNIGSSTDYRVPDQAYLRDPSLSVFNPTAAVIVEIVSPGDESLAKLPFYAERGVEEVLLVDLAGRSASWRRRGSTGFEPVAASQVLGISGEQVRDAIRWPG